MHFNKIFKPYNMNTEVFTSSNNESSNIKVNTMETMNFKSIDLENWNSLTEEQKQAISKEAEAFIMNTVQEWAKKGTMGRSITALARFALKWDAPDKEPIERMFIILKNINGIEANIKRNKKIGLDTSDEEASLIKMKLRLTSFEEQHPEASVKFREQVAKAE